MKWTQSIRSAKNGTNLQAARDINFGLSYGETKEVARDTAMAVFRDNFATLSQQAHRIACARAEELFCNLLTVIAEDVPVENFEDPGLQSAILEAQSGYARSGDEDSANALVALLADRVSLVDRSLTQLALDQALKIVPSLTRAHFSALAVSFLSREVTPEGNTIPEIAQNCARLLGPHNDGLHSAGYADVDYLVGLGCLSIEPAINPYGHYLALRRPGIFTHGFKPDNKEKAKLLKTGLVVPHPEKPEYFVFASATANELRDEIRDREVDFYVGNIATELLHKSALSGPEVNELLIRHEPSLEAILRGLPRYGLNRYKCTLAGVAIGNAAACLAIESGYKVPLSEVLEPLKATNFERARRY